MDQLFHIIGLVGIVGHQRIKRSIHPIRHIETIPNRHAVCVVGGQEINQAAQLQQSLDIILPCTIGHRRAGCVHFGTAQLFGGHGFIRDGFHHIGAGHEHIARILHHEDEIGHGGGIDIAARARAHDHRNLRDHARCNDIAAEYFAVTTKGCDALLNTRSACIKQADDRRPHFQGHILDLVDLGGMGFRQ